jgi:5-methylcytosine-specific restriction endonuclease McrA
MPRAFLRPCRYCRQACDLHPSGYCPDCRENLPEQTDESRGSSRERGYTKQWEKLRRKALARDQFTCCGCGWQPDTVKTANEMGTPIPIPQTFEELRQRFNRRQRHLVVDHIVPIRTNPKLRLSLPNLQTLCAPDCHSAKTKRER